MKNRKIGFWSVILVVALHSCHIADLRTKVIKKNTQTQKEIEKGKNLLKETIQAQGVEEVGRFTTYEVSLTDSWKGVIGKMGNPWDWNQDEMILRYSLGDFDGQVEVMSGSKEGF